MQMRQNGGLRGSQRDFRLLIIGELPFEVLSCSSACIDLVESLVGDHEVVSICSSLICVIGRQRSGKRRHTIRNSPTRLTLNSKCNLQHSSCGNTNVVLGLLKM